MLRLILAAALLATLASPATADPKGKGKPDRQSESREVAGAIITAAERALIQDFYRSQGSGQVDALPPGIQKKVARGKPLPPGIAKKLPNGLSARLTPRAGYDFRQVGADVLLVEAATGLIVDILSNVAR